MSQEQLDEWSNYQMTVSDKIGFTISNLWDSFWDNWPFIIIPIIFVFMIWGLGYSIFVNEKEVDGHTFIRMSTYDWEHSPNCICEE